MARLSRARGFTLLEVMVAMVVLLIGSLGVLSVQAYGVRMNEDGRVMTRATELAQDLIAQMQTWDYNNDARLLNVNAANDGSIASPLYSDPDGQFEGTVTSAMYDHEESELEASPLGWNGVPSASLPTGFTRYWNIAELDYDANGALLGRRVAAIVRWDRNGLGRRIVVTTFLPNPAATN
ncbi:MAG TPA: prepilin-type N-terminal cleavage/methylation domain-containing protein [Anaeromyxobacter sp.]|nr:prepilin-type N-terminal cleavage/methylation domain-containing protein [Anaeromyxobacter sp.]